MFGRWIQSHRDLPLLINQVGVFPCIASDWGPRERHVASVGVD